VAKAHEAKFSERLGQYLKLPLFKPAEAKGITENASSLLPTRFEVTVDCRGGGSASESLTLSQVSASKRKMWFREAEDRFV
jgi:hypothetical protein